MTTAEKAPAKKAAPHKATAKTEHKPEPEAKKEHKDVKVEAVVELGSCPNQNCPLHLHAKTVEAREAAINPVEPVILEPEGA